MSFVSYKISPDYSSPEVRRLVIGGTASLNSTNENAGLVGPNLRIYRLTSVQKVWLTAVAGDTKDYIISGLGSDYLPISETITANGTTAVESTLSYRRVNEVLLSSSAATHNDGEGSVTLWRDSGTTERVLLSRGAFADSWRLGSNVGRFTVPAGKKLFVKHVFATHDTGSDTGIPFSVSATVSSGGPSGYVTLDSVEYQKSGFGVIQDTGDLLEVPEKSEVSFFCGSPNQTSIAHFTAHCLLVDADLVGENGDISLEGQIPASSAVEEVTVELFNNGGTIPDTLMTGASTLDVFSTEAADNAGDGLAASGTVEIVDYTALPGVKASATLTVVDYTALTGASFSVNGITYDEGSEWFAATSNDATAASIQAAILDDDLEATVSTNVVTISAAEPGIMGNSIPITTSDATNLPRSATTLSGGVDRATVTVGGLVFTAGVSFLCETDNGTTAENLKEAINSSLSASATRSGAVVTIEWGTIGVAGNDILLDSSDPTNAPTSDVTLTGGQDAGTGLRSFVIEGLDASGQVISETVELDGLSPVTTTNQYRVVNRVHSPVFGSASQTIGFVSVQTTGSSSSHAMFRAGSTSGQVFRYGIKDGYTGYLAGVDVIASPMSDGIEPRLHLSLASFDYYSASSYKARSLTGSLSINGGAAAEEDTILRTDPAIKFPVPEGHVITQGTGLDSYQTTLLKVYLVLVPN